MCSDDLDVCVNQAFIDIFGRILNFPVFPFISDSLRSSIHCIVSSTKIHMTIEDGVSCDGNHSVHCKLKWTMEQRKKKKEKMHK